MTIRAGLRRLAKWAALALSVGVTATWGWLMTRGQEWRHTVRVDCASGDFTDLYCTMGETGIDAGFVTWRQPVFLKEVDVVRPPGNLEDLLARIRLRRFLLPSLWQSQDSASLHLPPWLVLFAGPTALLWWRDRRRIPPGHCQKCGYNLTGNVSGVCPECGTPTPPDPAHQSTDPPARWKRGG